jgi:hypothetical protein
LGIRNKDTAPGCIKKGKSPYNGKSDLEPHQMESHIRICASELDSPYFRVLVVPEAAQAVLGYFRSKFSFFFLVFF